MSFTGRQRAGPDPEPKTNQETGMAKGQKKTNKEVRKPKTAKAKPAAETKSFLSPITKK